MVTPADVHEFWFGAIASDGTVAPERSSRWYAKDDVVDDEIRTRFGAALDGADRGELDAWKETREGRVALIVALDQFSRNLGRGSARAFANDARALALSREIVRTGELDELRAPEAQFVIMPFMHSENLEDQDDCIALFERTARRCAGKVAEGLRMAADFGRRHRVIVERFGRFPHRNEALGRESTPEETAFLKQPGSSF